MTTPRFSAGTDVAPIQADQFDLAGRALARGFHNDPLAIYMLPDPGERARLLPAHFAAFLRLGCISGEVYTTRGEPEGAAVWFQPHEAGSEAERTDGGEDPALGLPQEAFERFVTVTSALEPLHDAAVPASHYYLALLGVDRDLHGQGVGSRLLQPVLARADAEGVYCYLETYNPANVPFYRKHGFEVVVEDIEPNSAVRFWTFRRPPRQ
ncbi:MAG TPA: GNAT family N-acetyltransferase [Ktedonobacterales bacterium]|nr:GNAT family N-acetyltransferase [Ktedonobacterales bacterium]